MADPEILIATPAYDGNVKTGYVRSLVATQTMLHAHGIKYGYKTVEGSDVVVSRNYLGALMLEQPKYTHILFVDADMTFDPLTVARMIVEKKPLIGCVYPKRTVDLNRVIELAQEYKDPQQVLALAHEFVVRFPTNNEDVQVVDGLVKVAGLGMGLCLISREVFTRLAATSKLSMHQTHPKSGLKNRMHGFFDQMVVDDGMLSEDLAFCERWRTLCGGDVWAMTADRIGHIGSLEFAVPYIEYLRLKKK